MNYIVFNPDVSLCCRPLTYLPLTHASYMFDEMSERNPLIFSSRKWSCSCFCCYSAAHIPMSNRLTAISPSFLCKGLSQSTVIQYSLTKRLICYSASSRGFYGNTTGVSFPDRNSYHEKLFYINERRKQRGFGHKRKKQFLGNVSDDYVNDVEVILSLLTDEVGLDNIYVRDRNKIDKKHIICDNKQKKDVGSGIVNKDPNCDDEQVKILSESKMKNCEEIFTEVSDTFKDIKEEKHQNTNHLTKTTMVSSSEKSIHISQVPDTHITDSESSSDPNKKSDKHKLHQETSNSSEAKVTATEHEYDHSSLEMKGPSDEMWHVTDTSDDISSSSENGKFDEWENAYSYEGKKRKDDEMFMREALLEAKKAADVAEVPVGAVLVHRGQIIARGYNLVEELYDSTAHAEMICIRQASKSLNSWRLTDTTLYVTLEPCPMCAGAILQARIGTVVWGAPNKLLGADGSWIRLFFDGNEGKDDMSPDKPPAPLHPFHHNMVVRRGVLAEECAGIMKNFFRLRRKKKTQLESLIPSEPESAIPPESESPIPLSSFTVSNDHSSFFSKMQHAFKIIFCL